MEASIKTTLEHFRRRVLVRVWGCCPWEKGAKKQDECMIWMRHEGRVMSNNV